MTIGVVSPPVWLSDSFQQGTGRAWTFLAVMLVEQGSRLALFLLLVPRFQFAGILGATLAATVVKAVVGWTVNHRLVVPLRLSVWSTFAAPAVAGVANYAVWRAFVAFAHPSTSPGVLALMCAASASSFFVTFFVCGAAGGFDGAALGELREASRMTSFGRALAGAFSAVAHAGARACPFPVPSLSTEAAARAEASELDQASARNRSLRSA